MADDDCPKCKSMCTDFIGSSTLENPEYACEQYECLDCGYDFGIILH